MFLLPCARGRDLGEGPHLPRSEGAGSKSTRPPVLTALLICCGLRKTSTNSWSRGSRQCPRQTGVLPVRERTSSFSSIPQVTAFRIILRRLAAWDLCCARYRQLASFKDPREMRHIRQPQLANAQKQGTCCNSSGHKASSLRDERRSRRTCWTGPRSNAALIFSDSPSQAAWKRSQDHCRWLRTAFWADGAPIAWTLIHQYMSSIGGPIGGAPRSPPPPPPPLPAAFEANLSLPMNIIAYRRLASVRSSSFD